VGKLTMLGLSEMMRAELAAAKPVPAAIEAKSQQTVGPELFTLGGNYEDAGWRRITAPNTLRDLNPLMQQRMQQVCFYLSVTNPFAKMIIRLINAFIVGEGFKVVCTDHEAQAVVDAFWKDTVNKMNRSLADWTREKLIFGELCLPVAVNPVNGFVRIGYIDPEEIDAVEHGMMQTGDGRSEISIPVAVRLRQRLGESEGRRLRIIRPDEDVNSPTYGQVVGDCFYYAINKSKTASRGISELFALADWADVLDQMVFDYADRARTLNAYVWDFTMSGADEATCEKYRKALEKRPPRQGSFQVHSDKVTIEAKTPDLKGADNAEGARMVKQYGCGGAGLPPHWLGDPSDGTRAVAAEMSGPTGKVLTEHQNEVKSEITDIVAFVLVQAQQHGVLSPAADLNFTLQVPDLLIRDFQVGAQTLNSATQALAIAEDRGWIRGETAARAFAGVLTQIGTEIEDTDQEYQQAQQTKQDKQDREQNALGDQKTLAEALRQAQPQLPAPKEPVVQ
jgi:hypothetical protein